MRKLLEYLRLVLFVGGVLVGIQIPTFVDQYGKRLDAHLQESELSIKQFQLDADKYFVGDLSKLVQHYQSSSDPVVSDGGKSIAKLQTRHSQLKTALQRFAKNRYSPFVETLIKPLPEIRSEAWAHYNFMIVLEPFALIWGLSAGLLLSLLSELILNFLALLFLRPFRRPKTRTHRQL